MGRLAKRINYLLTVLIIVCVLACGVFVVQIVSGQEANIFGYRLFHILTGSMEPSIEQGANTICKSVKDASTLKVGDIIVFRSKDPAIYGQMNTHRIVEIIEEEGGIAFVTKGDANSSVDMYTVAPADIYGKVVFHTNASKWFGLFFDFIHTRSGFVTVVILPLMLVVYFYVKDFVREVNAALEKQKEEILKEVEENEKSVEEEKR